MSLKRLLAILIFCCLPMPGQASQPAGDVLRLTDAQGEYRLGPWLEILEDPSGQLTIDDVTRPPHADRFQRNHRDRINFGFTESAFWIRLRLSNGASNEQWLLQQHYANTHYLDLYRPGPGGYQQRLSGNLRPPASRDLPYPHIVFKLPLPRGAEEVVYLRLKNGASSTIDLRLWQPEAFAIAEHRDSFWMGLFYGMLLIFLGYSLLTWLALGETSHLHLSLFVAAMLTTLAFYDGYAQRLFAADTDMAWSRYAIPVSMGLTILAMLGFIRRFLPPQRDGSWRARLHPVHPFVWAVILVLMPLLPYPHLLKLVATVSLGYVLFLLAWAILAWREGQPSARLYLSGWTLFLLGALWVLLVRLDWIEASSMSASLPIRFGLVWLVLFTSLAQASRLNHLMEESRRTGAALRESEEQRRLAMHAGGIGTWQCEDANRHIQWTPELESLTGLPAEAMAGGNLEIFRSRVHEDDWPELQEQLRAASEHGTPIDCQFRLQVRGEPRWFEIHGEVQQGRMRGTLQDIDERKRREAEAQEAQETLRRIAIAVSSHTGEAFFRELALSIARLFRYDYVFIGLRDERQFQHIRTIALCTRDGLSDNISYSYLNGPCQQAILEGEPVVLASGLGKRFPDNELVEKLRGESYVGLPLKDSQGQMLGIISVMDARPMDDPERIESVLRIYAARASAELQRLRSERELSGVRERLAQHIRNTPVAVIEWNTRIEVTAWNPAAERIFGYSEAEALGRHAAGLILPEEMPADVQRTWDALMALDGGTLNTNENLTRDGRTITCTWFNTPLVDEEGRVTGVASLVTDITEQVAAEAELARHREHLEELVDQRSSELRDQARIIEQVHDAVIVTDLEGRITYWNRHAEQQLGHEREEAIGRHLCFLFPPGEGRYCDRLLDELREHGDVEREVDLQTRAGQRLSLHLSLSTRHDAEGRPSGYIAIAFDISQRRHAEAELARQHRALENANRELEAFSYSVSHDLRAPLRALNGFSQALMEDYGDALDEQARDYIRRLRDATLRMSERIDGLLALSRLNRSALRRQRVDLGHIARHIAEQLQGSDPERVVDWAIDEGISAEGDERLLTAALDNLLSNAWKYTSREPRARIAFEAMEGEDGETVFVVSDNGVGFDMRYADKLFGAFQRLHSEADFPGSGVGLATVARIIHRHGGRVWAEAETGRGARFYFTLS